MFPKDDFAKTGRAEEDKKDQTMREGKRMKRDEN